MELLLNTLGLDFWGLALGIRAELILFTADLLSLLNVLSNIFVCSLLPTFRYNLPITKIISLKEDFIFSTAFQHHQFY